jgi:hypothetical protein
MFTVVVAKLESVTPDPLHPLKEYPVSGVAVILADVP